MPEPIPRFKNSRKIKISKRQIRIFIAVNSLVLKKILDFRELCLRNVFPMLRYGLLNIGRNSIACVCPVKGDPSVNCLPKTSFIEINVRKENSGFWNHFERFFQQAFRAFLILRNHIALI